VFSCNGRDWAGNTSPHTADSWETRRNDRLRALAVYEPLSSVGFTGKELSREGLHEASSSHSRLSVSLLLDALT
jgi:hypothetical protein